MFCLVTILTGSQLQFAFTIKITRAFIQLATGYLNSLNITHNLCKKDLNYIQFSLGS